MASICDGTKNHGSENCDEPGRWLIRVNGNEGSFHNSCDRHLSQVGRRLLHGERGALDVRSIFTDER